MYLLLGLMGFSCAHLCSIGLRWEGEYGGRYNRICTYIRNVFLHSDELALSIAHYGAEALAEDLV